MAGGIAPRSTSSWAVRTLMQLAMVDRGDRRARPDRGVESVDVDEGVGMRRAQVDHEIGLVEQAAADARVERRSTSTGRRR